MVTLRAWHTGTLAHVSGDERELRTAWQRHIGVGERALRWFDEVVARHREPGRHYHDLRHVRWVVRHVRELAAGTSPPVAGDALDRVVAAACFHDAVYDAQRPDNEAASARLARRALTEIGWSAEACDRVEALIQATAHAETPGDGVGDLEREVLLAADLAVLAAEPTRYGDYVRAVRREYAHLDDDAWSTGRSAFATAMLERAHIFPSSLGLQQWERRARANLAAELAALRG